MLCHGLRLGPHNSRFRHAAVIAERLPCQKHLFGIPEKIAYLNAAYMSPSLLATESAMEAGARCKTSPWNITKDDFYHDKERLRGKFARLVDASVDDVAIVPSASYGTAVAAANVQIERQSNIVTLGMEHTSNRFVWQIAAAEMSAEVRVVPPPARLAVDAIDWTEALFGLVDNQTSLVAVAGTHWLDGTEMDLAAVALRCQEVGAAFVIDGTQHVGALPLSIAQLKPDFLIVAGYKWLFCPYGISFLVASPRFRECGRGLEQHGWGELDSGRGRAMWGMSGGETEEGVLDLSLPLSARRFDMGGLAANFALIRGALGAIDQLLVWTPERIAASISPLTSAVAESARARGWVVPDKHSVHMVGLRQAGGNSWPSDLVEHLWERHHVHISGRGDCLRVSPNVYNCLEDVDRLFAALDAELRV